MNYITHDFYCINCGNKGIPIARNRGHMHNKGHFKKLYCCTCKCEVNHIEIFNESQLEKFKEDFKNGVYKDEAEKSISSCRPSGLW